MKLDAAYFFQNIQSFVYSNSSIFSIFFGGLECVGHSFAYVGHFDFLRDFWIRTQRAAVANRAGIFKLLWSPGIDSRESIPPVYVAWRAGTTTLFQPGS